MKLRLSWKQVFLTPCILLALSSSAFASSYMFTTLDAPGVAWTVATGINNGGQIVGTFSDATGKEHGFLLDALGGFTTLDVPGARGTDAYGINDVGQMVVRSIDATGQHSFLYSGGVFTPVNVPLAPRTVALGINDAGLLVGVFDDATGKNHGFLLDALGGFTTLDVPGARSTGAHGINDVGQIVGAYARPSEEQPHAFLYDSGAFTPFDIPGVFTEALGINDAGQMVGAFRDTTGVHGFLAIRCSTLEPGCVPLSERESPPHPVVPEPSSLLLLGSGLVGLVAWRRKLPTL